MLNCLDLRVFDIGTVNDIWNVDSILRCLCQHLEARRPVVHSGLASPDSGYDRDGVGMKALA